MSEKDADRLWFESITVCPACLAPDLLRHEQVQKGRRYYHCSRCRRFYPVNQQGVIDFQVIDKLLKLPAQYLGMWALAQMNALSEYKSRSAGSVSLPERDVVKAFLNFMDLEDRTVLDIGSGTDYVPGYVVAKKMKHFVMIDPLPVESAIPYARIQGWAEYLPFAEGSFDVIIIGTSLDHVLCLESTLMEIRRVLKSDGIIYAWGSWWPDHTYFKNVPEKPLFSRFGDDPTAGPRSFEEQARDRQVFLEVTSDKAKLNAQYAKYLVDQWHFRHIPLLYVKHFQLYDLQVETFDLWEWNYHEGHIFLNGFFKLKKDLLRRGDMTVLRDIDRTSLLAKVVDSIDQLTPPVRALKDSLRANDQTIILHLTRLASLQEREFRMISERLDKLERQTAAVTPKSVRGLRRHPYRLTKYRFKSALTLFWTKTGHGKLLALTCYDLAPLWRKIRGPRPAAGGKTTVCHVTCSFDLGGTQRQIRNLCTGNGDPRFEHLTDEIFPEQNFIYRQGIHIEAVHYVKGNFISRKFGRWVMDINYRSLQLVQIYKLWRDFQRLRPQVVVGWGHEMATLTFAAAAFARVPKIVFCIRTWNPNLGWTLIPRLLYKSHRRMLPSVDGVIVNSTLLQKDYAQWQGIPPERIAVCPNGIDAIPFEAESGREAGLAVRRSLGIPEDAVVIMNIGRFSPEKGQRLLLKAFEKVLRAGIGDGLVCVLCGDGPLLDAAKDFVAERRINHCLFPGRVHDISAYLRAADIYVMPSDFEGMPNAMMEAMACGLPCISTNRSGALDIARDRQEALYVDVGADDQLAEKLLYLIRNPEERRRLGQNASRRLKIFSLDKMVAHFNEILARIAGEQA